MDKAFIFEEGYIEPKCDFCGKDYENLGVQVSFRDGPPDAYVPLYEICYSCLLKGPKVVSAETTHRPAREFNKGIRRWFMNVKSFAKSLGDLDAFHSLPGGILAVKIAEAYREMSRPRPRQAKKTA